MGTSRYCRHGVRGTRDASRSARRDRGGRAGHAGISRIAVFALIIGLAAACGRRATVVHAAPHQVGDEISFTSLESPSLQFLPRQQEAAGWKLDEDPIVIPGDHLGSYLDSDAAHFARYALLDLTIGKYSATGGGGF